MTKRNSTIKRTFGKADVQLLLLALDIIRRFNADELADLFDGTRQAQNYRTRTMLSKLEEDK